MLARVSRTCAPFCAALLLLCTPAAHARPLRAPGGAILVKGAPRLILGLYETPTDDAVLREAIGAGFNLFRCGADTAELDRMQRLGAMAWIGVGSDLDLSEDAAARGKRLKDTARRFSKHPALLFWEGPDEALWIKWSTPTDHVPGTEAPAMDAAIKAAPASETAALQALRERAVDTQARALWAECDQARRAFWRRVGRPGPQSELVLANIAKDVARTGAGLSAGMRCLRAADPTHMIWMNHAPRNSVQDMLAYNREADMAGCDIYPIPFNVRVGHSDLTNVRPSAVGDYTDRMRRAAPGKACAMVLQAFGWRDLEPAATRSDALRRLGFGRRPTLAESRFMAYDALLHGANAVMYWGTSYSRTDEQGDPSAPAAPGGSRLWRDLLAVAAELRALEPALIAPEVPGVRAAADSTYASVDSDGPGLRASLRRVGKDWVLVVANENPAGVAFAVRSLPRALEGVRLYRLGSTEAATVRNGALRDGIAFYNVHVYATSRRFEPAARPNP